MEQLFDITGEPATPETLYSNFLWPVAPSARPAVCVNMVMSLDGKITIGDPGDNAQGLGGPMDQTLMRRIQQRAECVIIGATTLRAGRIAYPPSLTRAVVTASGDLPLRHSFFTSAQAPVYVFTGSTAPVELEQAVPDTTHVIRHPHPTVDLISALAWLRAHGIQRLLCEGGGALNYAMFRDNLVDELFLTLAPKIKGGENIRTPVEGEGLPRERVGRMTLVSVYTHDGELYLRSRSGERFAMDRS